MNKISPKDTEKNNKINQWKQKKGIKIQLSY